MELCLKILDADQKTRAVGRGTDEVNLVYSQEYREGDRIILETSGDPAFLWLQLDDALGMSLVCLKRQTPVGMLEDVVNYFGGVLPGARLQKTARSRQQRSYALHVLPFVHYLEFVDAVDCPGCVFWRACHPVDACRHRQRAVGLYLYVESCAFE